MPLRTRGGDWRVNDSGRNIGLDPRDDRYGVFGRLSYEVGDNVELFAEAAYNKQEVLFNAGPNLQTGIVLNGPSMPGTKLGPALPYHFDEVFHLDIGRDQATQKDYRFLRTQPDFQNDAKDRSGKLDAIEYPDLGNIIRKITATS